MDIHHYFLRPDHSDRSLISELFIHGIMLTAAILKACMVVLRVILGLCEYSCILKHGSEHAGALTQKCIGTLGSSAK